MDEDNQRSLSMQVLRRKDVRRNDHRISGALAGGIGSALGLARQPDLIDGVASPTLRYHRTSSTHLNTPPARAVRATSVRREGLGAGRFGRLSATNITGRTLMRALET